MKGVTIKNQQINGSPPVNRTVFFAFIIGSLLAMAAPITCAEEPLSSAGLNDSMLYIEGSIEKLQLLEEQALTASGGDREALLFRLDQRSIKLIDKVATLTGDLAVLPEDDPDRLMLEKRLRTKVISVDQHLFERIDGLEKRIKTVREQSRSGSDAEKYVQQAYLHSLEGLRLGYYSALAGIIKSRENLGISNDELRRNAEATLYQYAEKVSGRVEIFSNSLREIKARLTKDATNTSLLASANEVSIERGVEITRLESLLSIMSQLDMNTVLYRSVLLREDKGVSLRMLDVEAGKRMLQDGWENTRKSLGKNIPDFLFKLLIFVLIIFIFKALSRLVKRFTGKALNKSSTSMSNLLKDILVSASGAAVMVLGILIALSQVGVSLGPALAGLGVAGFIVGFALQDTLGNFAAGAMILIYRPYDVDDFVEVAGTAGLVKKMTLVSTTIITFDNQTLIIPNSKIWGDVIKNVTAQQTRRVDLEFAISYGDDIEKAEQVLRDIVSSHEKVLPEPAPTIRLHRLGDSSVDFVVRPWTNTANYWEVYWDITREVKLRFDREGISIPFPQRDVHLQQAT